MSDEKKIDELLSMFDELNERARRDVLDVARFKLWKQKRTPAPLKNLLRGAFLFCLFKLEKMFKKKIIILLLVLPLLACTLTNASSIANPSKPALDDSTPQTIKRPQVTKADSITCTVTAFQTLNVREIPSMQSAVIAVLQHGEIVTVLADDVENVWWKIQTQNVAGWIHSNYCERN